MDQSRPVIFVSYSWDSENHREWVLKLANDLVSQYGVDVILDQYELSAGRDLVHFMESSIERASKVVVVLNPNYKIKAEARKGGVGAEYSMISQGIFNVQSSDKFVPILREGDQTKSCPGYLKSRVYHSMGREPVKIRIATFRFDLNLQKDPIWIDKNRQGRPYESVELAQRAFSDILEKIRHEKEKGFR